jgi:hypothetical protein
MLHIFHINVASVHSRYFICFIRMLHLSVSCCSESQGHGGVVVAGHVRWVMGHDDLGASRRGARHASVLRTGLAWGRRSGRD